MRVSRPIIAAALCAAALLITGCSASSKDGAEQSRIRETLLALDTVVDLTVYGEPGNKGLDAAKGTIARLEALLSVTEEGSDIYRINHSGGEPVPVDRHTAVVINYAQTISAITGGRFDISIYPVVRAWGFTTSTYRVPAADELETLLERVDHSLIADNVSERTVTVPDGMMIDLGGIAKGYIGDRMIDAIRDTGIQSAIINLGGNVQTLGQKPDGSDWIIGIRDPADQSATVCSVTTGESAVITSGWSQRYFTDPEGIVYHHIIDPETGYPANSGLVSATVVIKAREDSDGFIPYFSMNGAFGDGMSTAVYVMGKDAAIDFWREWGSAIGYLEFELILITDSGEVVITPGLEGRVTMTSEDYTLTVAR